MSKETKEKILKLKLEALKLRINTGTISIVLLCALSFIIMMADMLIDIPGVAATLFVTGGFVAIICGATIIVMKMHEKQKKVNAIEKYLNKEKSKKEVIYGYNPVEYEVDK